MNNSIGLLFVSLHFFASLRFLSYLLLGCGCVAPSLYLIAPHHEKAPPPAAQYSRLATAARESIPDKWIFGFIAC